MAKNNFNSPVPMIKLEDFTGSVFSEWKRNTQFGMRFLNLYYTVQSDFESCKEDVDEYQWSKDEEFCKDYILNCLSSRLAETYSQLKTAKEIWDALEAQFKKEEDLSKTHLVDKFMAFTFDESKPILPQVTDLEILVSKLKCENIIVCDAFLCGAIIFKLPSAWLSFKTEMHRKKVQIGLDDLKRFIRIEDENRSRTALEMVTKQQSAANMVSNHRRPPKPIKSKSSVPHLPQSAKKIKKFKGKCFNCNKWGHSASDCRQPKKVKSNPPNDSNQANMISNVESSNFIAMVGNNKANTEWWLDSGATCHVTNNASLLSNLTQVRESVTVANGDKVEVHQTGTADLLLSSGMNTSSAFAGITQENEEDYFFSRKLPATEKWMQTAAGRHLIGPGSSPPTCRSRCGRCFPCRPIHVAIQPGRIVPLEYYPEAWRCKCGNTLFMP